MTSTDYHPPMEHGVPQAGPPGSLPPAPPLWIDDGNPNARLRFMSATEAKVPIRLQENAEAMRLGGWVEVPRA